MKRSTRFILAGLVISALAATPGKTAPGGCTNAPSLNPFAFEQVTVSTASIGFTAATFAPSGQTPADFAVVSVESQAIRYRDDGVAPSTTVGHVVAAASSFTVCGLNSIRIVRFIRDDASDATLDVSYYRAQ